MHEKISRLTQSISLALFSLPALSCSPDEAPEYEVPEPPKMIVHDLHVLATNRVPAELPVGTELKGESGHLQLYFDGDTQLIQAPNDDFDRKHSTASATLALKDGELSLSGEDDKFVKALVSASAFVTTSKCTISLNVNNGSDIHEYALGFGEVLFNRSGPNWKLSIIHLPTPKDPLKPEINYFDWILGPDDSMELAIMSQ